MEASINEAIRWARFERNDAYTWQRVRQRVEAYLTSAWREGALVGATPKDAFFVDCDAGLTMTKADIEQGFLVLEVGIAPVRPGDFVMLRFVQSCESAFPTSPAPPPPAS